MSVLEEKGRRGLKIMDELQIIVSLHSLEIFQENNIKKLDNGHPKGKVIKILGVDFWRTNDIRLGSFLSLLW